MLPQPWPLRPEAMCWIVYLTQICSLHNWYKSIKKWREMALISSSASLVPVSSNGNVWSAGMELVLQLAHSLQDSCLSSMLSCNSAGLQGAGKSDSSRPLLHCLWGIWTQKIMLQRSSGHQTACLEDIHSPIVLKNITEANNASWGKPLFSFDHSWWAALALLP